MIPYHKMDWRVVKWSFLNTFELNYVELDDDQWDEFGSYEWFWHWTRPYLAEVWYHVKLPLVRPAQVTAAPIAWIDRIVCFTEWIYVDLWEDYYYLWIPLDPRLIGAFFLVGFYLVCFLVCWARKYGDYMVWDYVGERPALLRLRPRHRWTPERLERLQQLEWLERPEGLWETENLWGPGAPWGVEGGSWGLKGQEGLWAEERPAKPWGRESHGFPNRYESFRGSPMRDATWRVCSRHRFSVQRTPVRCLPKSRCL